MSLKPCPFCGSKEPDMIEFEAISGKGYVVNCPECPAQMGYHEEELADFGLQDDACRASVIDAWNNRAAEAMN